MDRHVRWLRRRIFASVASQTAQTFVLVAVAAFALLQWRTGEGPLTSMFVALVIAQLVALGRVGHALRNNPLNYMFMNKYVERPFGYRVARFRDEDEAHEVAEQLPGFTAVATIRDPEADPEPVFDIFHDPSRLVAASVSRASGAVALVSSLADGRIMVTDAHALPPHERLVMNVSPENTLASIIATHQRAVASRRDIAPLVASAHQVVLDSLTLEYESYLALGPLLSPFLDLAQRNRSFARLVARVPNEELSKLPERLGPDMPRRSEVERAMPMTAPLLPARPAEQPSAEKSAARPDGVHNNSPAVAPPAADVPQVVVSSAAVAAPVVAAPQISLPVSIPAAAAVAQASEVGHPIGVPAAAAVAQAPEVGQPIGVPAAPPAAAVAPEPVAPEPVMPAPHDTSFSVPAAAPPAPALPSAAPALAATVPVSTSAPEPAAPMPVHAAMSVHERPDVPTPDVASAAAGSPATPVAPALHTPVVDQSDVPVAPVVREPFDPGFEASTQPAVRPLSAEEAAALAAVQTAAATVATAADEVPLASPAPATAVSEAPHVVAESRAVFDPDAVGPVPENAARAPVTQEVPVVVVQQDSRVAKAPASLVDQARAASGVNPVLQAEVPLDEVPLAELPLSATPAASPAPSPANAAASALPENAPVAPWVATPSSPPPPPATLAEAVVTAPDTAAELVDPNYRKPLTEQAPELANVFAPVEEHSPDRPRLSAMLRTPEQPPVRAPRPKRSRRRSR